MSSRKTKGATSAHKVDLYAIELSCPLDLIFNYAQLMGDEVPRCLSGKEPSCQCRRHGFNLWVGKIPWRKAPVFLLEESLEQRSLTGYSP